MVPLNTSCKATCQKIQTETPPDCQESSFGRLGGRSGITYPWFGGWSPRTCSQTGEEINRRDTNGHDSYSRGAVRVRAQHTAAQGGYRLNDRHCDRVVRFLPLRHGSRAHFRQAVFSQFGPADGDARRLRNLFHRLCRAPDRRRDFWPLRRPHWPQSDADCNAVVHGHRDLPDRIRSDLRNHRHLGRGYPDGAADASGHRRRRRMGWVRSAGDGMVASSRPARPGGVLAAIRRAVRPVPGESRSAGVQPAVG
jgi:hypothetical protein